MITETASRKMIVISDLHLGNPFCRSKRNIVEFLRWLSKTDYDLCINGDGFDIAQFAFPRLVQDVPDVLQMLRTLGHSGRRIYYVVGNHDILLEHFLEDWGNITLSPFLNLRVDDKLVRIEHGHLYDPFFVRWPRVYEFMTVFSGLVLKVFPDLYRLWIRFERFLWNRPNKRTNSIVGEPPQFLAAATALMNRGFDSVIFGHTHHVGAVSLGNGKTYFNPGSWLLSTHYVEINNGEASMKLWA